MRRAAEAEILAALIGSGETLSRQVVRLPEGDNVTDSKVAFSLALVDADFIQPRETVVMRIVAADVKVAYDKLREALGKTKTKTRVLTDLLNDQDKRNITAQLDFTYSRADEAGLANGPRQGRRNAVAAGHAPGREQQRYRRQGAGKGRVDRCRLDPATRDA